MAVRPALRRLGMMTPWAPAHSAVRMMAPRLWGSSSSSQRTKKGGSPRSWASWNKSSTVAYSFTAATATTPWWLAPPQRWSSLRGSASLMAAPAALALATRAERAPERSPRWMYRLSMVRPARRASLTALRPAMMSAPRGSCSGWRFSRSFCKWATCPFPFENGPPGCPGPGPKLRFWHNIFALYHSFPEISNKNADKKGEKPVFFRRGRQGNPFWGIFFQNLQENSFFAPSCPRTFPHCRPLQPPFPRGNVENSVETVKNPCPHAGFHFPPFSQWLSFM